MEINGGNKKAKTKAKTILPLTDKENQQDDNQIEE
jgi:hypothetical protein